jgi:DNA-binding NarL/FixJ family response regulator
MRVIVVGDARDRARLRAELDGSMEIVGEFASVAAAREAGEDADAFIVARRIASYESRANPREADAGGVAEPLTRREIDVLELLAEGLSNKAIAARLGISDQTVKFHVSAIAGKLGAANRTDAVRRAVRRGLIAL